MGTTVTLVDEVLEKLEEAYRKLVYIWALEHASEIRRDERFPAMSESVVYIPVKKDELYHTGEDFEHLVAAVNQQDFVVEAKEHKTGIVRDASGRMRSNAWREDSRLLEIRCKPFSALRF